MNLKSLLASEAPVPASASEVMISGLTADSRQVAPGFVFSALSGTQVDGARFVPQAVEHGAVAILAGEDAVFEAPQHVTVVRTRDPRRTLARLAARFYGAQPETTVAITGTSGKTSVVDFTRQIFSRLGHAAASLGTIGVVLPSGAEYGSLTTPDPVALHASLAQMSRDGVTHLAFEASSHGLEQRRLDGVELVAGAFTNLGHDHLDYHPSVEAYMAAKLRLFDTLLTPGDSAVINADGARSDDVVAIARERGLQIMTTGQAGDTLRLKGARQDGFAQLLEIEHAGRTFEVHLPLIGIYQASNALLAAGLVLAVGEQVDAVIATLEGLKGVKGRLEVVGETSGAIAVVDYAHKPDALIAVLDALRPFASGRLICVVGCGGDRDQEKRPMMGRIASQKADMVIVTDDNPRTEDPAAIRAAILAAAPDAREIGDRAEAIATGVAELGPGDVLVVAGKGHEPGQIIGERTIPFSDHDAIAAAIAGEAYNA